MRKGLFIILTTFFLFGCGPIAGDINTYDGTGLRASDVRYTKSTDSAPPYTSIDVSSSPTPNWKPALQPADFAIDPQFSYHAVVIGINDYTRIPRLTTACSDATAVAKTLEDDYGFSVRLLLNATRADILRSLTAFRNCGPDDSVLVYYAGHGWLDSRGDEGYWLPIDSDAQDRVNWLANATISTELRASNARHVLVVADSCYSGKLTRELRVVTDEPGYYEKLAQRKARVAISSGGLEPVIDSGGKDGHSVFASAFLDALRDNPSALDALSLFTRIRQSVGWNADQMPEYGVIHKTGHDGGDFIFQRVRR